MTEPTMTKYQAMSHLLDELRTARPLLLPVEPWIVAIERVLALPDDVAAKPINLADPNDDRSL